MNSVEASKRNGLGERWRELYVYLRAQYHRVRKIFYFWHDMCRTYRYMHWDSRSARTRYWPTSSSLLFQYHKLEKGLCIPGAKRAFGADPAESTIEILKEWRQGGFRADDPVYRGALETLRAYRDRLYETPLDGRDDIVLSLERELSQADGPEVVAGRPNKVELNHDIGLFAVLEKMSLQRRSVRSFSPQTVALELIERAISIAQLSPSACNRQPCRVHVFSNRNAIDKMLSLQNGNRGFGQTIPTLLVLTAETTGFFDASERNQPYVDGGLFAMSLLYALHAQGVASCCLNWCVSPSEDRVAHYRGSIPDSEIIVMYIAIGYAADDALVPRSPRRAVDSILIPH